jgi:hypothetical protein
MRDFIEDVRYGLRELRNHPQFTLIAGFALAEGIRVIPDFFRVSSTVLFLVLQRFQLAFTGIAFGLVGAFALTEVINSLLYRVQPIAIAAVSAIPSGGLAFWLTTLPPGRAAKVNPMAALG